VPILGITQILAWGALFYPPVLTMPLIAADRGWSISFTSGGFSAGLFCGGLAAPTIGRLIDRFGGHWVMGCGSLLAAAGLVALVNAEHPAAYIAAWAVLGVAMAASLYDPAFASLGRIFGAAARRPITLLTFIGGFASTVSWPVTHYLLEQTNWRVAYLIYAGLLACVAAPLYAFALPRERADIQSLPTQSTERSGKHLPPHGLTFLAVATGFACYAFIPSGMSAHMLAIFSRGGIDPTTAVAIGALFGPAQVAARLGEFSFAGRLHPLTIAQLALALLLAAFVLLEVAGLSVLVAATFVLAFGISNGLLTIARGTVPLALFGAAGYGRIVGRMSRPWLVVQAAAPLIMATLIENFSDKAGLGAAALFVLLALVSLSTVRASTL
jgi:MFS family permease